MGEAWKRTALSPRKAANREGESGEEKETETKCKLLDPATPEAILPLDFE